MAADSYTHVHSRKRLLWAINEGMKPLIGVTTSELRPSSAGTLRRHGEPPHPRWRSGSRTCGPSRRPAACPSCCRRWATPRPTSTGSTASAFRAARTSIRGLRRPRAARRARPHRARAGRLRARAGTRGRRARAADPRHLPRRPGAQRRARRNAAPAPPGHRQTEPATAATHTVHVEPGSRLARVVGTGVLRVDSFHHQAVDVLGRGLRAVAHAADGIHRGDRAPGPRLVLGVQWHAEGRSTSRATARCSTSWCPRPRAPAPRVRRAASRHPHPRTRDSPMRGGRAAGMLQPCRCCSPPRPPSIASPAR